MRRASALYMTTGTRRKTRKRSPAKDCGPAVERAQPAHSIIEVEQVGVIVEQGR